MIDFNESECKLPIIKLAPSVIDELSRTNRLIVSAPPGAGKSTVLPILIARSFSNDKLVIMLEPRRLAAITLARRIAYLLHEPIGQTAGFMVRHEYCYSESTRILVVTEGLLTRFLLSEPDLCRASVVIFDEFHERSIHTDEAIALTLKCQEIFRPDLKIVVMSASIPFNELSEVLKCNVLKSDYKEFPVNIYHTNDVTKENLIKKAALTARDAMAKHPGHCLIFLPGRREIEDCFDILYPLVSTHYDVFALYGSMNSMEQQRILRPSTTGRRKLIISTNLSETSVTIDGVRIVVDSGLYRHVCYDPHTCLGKLTTSRISLDMALQRAGRAGRQGEGWCYRLYSIADEYRMAESRTPEILTNDITSLVLDAALYGAGDINQLPWVTPPPANGVLASTELLRSLGAINPDGSTNNYASHLGELPCHPRLASMLLNAQTDEERSVATDLAALLDENQLLQNFGSTDLNFRIDALRKSRITHSDFLLYSRINQIAEQFRNILKIRLDNSPHDPSVLSHLLARAYPERLAKQVTGNPSKYMLLSGSFASLPPHDDLEGQPFIVITDIDGDKQNGRIRSAAPLDPKDFASLVRTDRIIAWDQQQLLVSARLERRLGCILLSASPLTNVSRSEIDPVILDEIFRHGPHLLKFDDHYERFQRRVETLRLWRPELHLPDPSPEVFCSKAHELFAPYISDCLTANHLRKLDPAQIFYYWLLTESKHALNHYTPDHIVTPSGSKVRLLYQPNGQPPIWPVYIQDVFGLIDTPAVDDGRHPVVLHLLSPGRKPVQITQNLRSFWTETYPKLRSQLQSRYPRHSWPEDPLSATPTRSLHIRRKARN